MTMTTAEDGFIRWNSKPVEVPDWHDLTKYEPQAGYPKPAQAMRDMTGKYRAGLWINSKSLVFSNCGYADERAANEAAMRKIIELLKG